MIDRETRILVVDDNPAIHEDFGKILGSSASGGEELDDIERALFGGVAPTTVRPTFALESAFQGQEALRKVEEAKAAERPYALAFVDVRMPPGWDGIETIGHLWAIAPDLQCVICTAYSDYSWDDMVAKLGFTDRLFILKKPFDTIEVRQLAVSVGTKWHLGRQVEAQIRALETAAARAQELADLRARFVVRVSHEFRTPLTVVLAASDALGRYADRMTAEDRAARVAKIQEQVGHMTDLLDDTLMVAQGTADLGRCRPEPTDLAQLCQEVVASVGATANRSAELVTEVALDEPAPSIDPRLTRQILEKILANAVQYGGDQPRVRLEVTSAAGTIRLRVSDLGPGIPARDRARIFEPFYRGSNVGDTDGCGLGLAVVHRAVALQRGTIDVRETPGGGATVEVEIPATVPASDGREGEIAG